MVLAQSRLTTQSQISVPVEVRKRLGLEPGAVLEWDETDGQIIVRRAARYSFAAIRAALFAKGAPSHKSAAQLKAGPADYVRRRHARR